MKARTSTTLGLLALVFFACMGCTAITPFGQKEIPTESPPGSGQYQVVKMSPMGGSNVYTGQITKDLTVQGALEAAGAIKPFGSVTVDVMRNVPESGQILKMACEFQPGKKIIKYEQDYQILPGDRIMVTTEGSPIDKLFRR